MDPVPSDEEQAQAINPPTSSPPEKKSAKSRGTCAKGAGAPQPGKPTWKFIKPPASSPRKGKGKSSARKEDKRPETDRRPRIWANSAHDLKAVLPDLWKSKTGLDKESFWPYMLFVENTWPEDTWTDREIELSFVFDFTCHESDLQRSQKSAERDGNGPSEDVDMDASRVAGDGTSQTLTVPLPIPPDMEEFGYLHVDEQPLPVTIMVSRDCPIVPFQLPEDYRYMGLGIFVVTQVQYGRFDHPKPKPIPSSVFGRVIWKVRFMWISGGEDILADLGVGGLNYPWWAPAASDSMDVDEVERDPWGFRLGYYNYIPLDLFSPLKGGEFFPRGWWCPQCGMINSQWWFRHQLCRSALCTSKPRVPPPGLVEPMRALRDMYRVDTFNIPFDTIPTSAKREAKKFTSGIWTFTYKVNPEASAVHIFTCDREFLQKEADQLLEGIQADIVMGREDPTSPYFVYEVALDSYGRLDIPDDNSWFRLALDMIDTYLTQYWEAPERSFEVRSLVVRSWATSGKRGAFTFDARRTPYFILSLGSTFKIELTPKGGFGFGPTRTNASVAGAATSQQASKSRKQRKAGPTPAFDIDGNPTADDSEYAELAGHGGFRRPLVEDDNQEDDVHQLAANDRPHEREAHHSTMTASREHSTLLNIYDDVDDVLDEPARKRRKGKQKAIDVPEQHEEDDIPLLPPLSDDVDNASEVYIPARSKGKEKATCFPDQSDEEDIPRPPLWSNEPYIEHRAAFDENEPGPSNRVGRVVWKEPVVNDLTEAENEQYGRPDVAETVNYVGKGKDRATDPPPLPSHLFPLPPLSSRPFPSHHPPEPEPEPEPELPYPKIDPTFEPETAKVRDEKPNLHPDDIVVNELAMTLVHGDGVVLRGDEFTVRFNRSGTSILLIASLEFASGIGFSTAST